MPKFKKGDKVKLRSNAEQVCRKRGCMWHVCWKNAIGFVGEVDEDMKMKGKNSKVNVTFQTKKEGSFWIYADMIMHLDEEEMIADTSEIHTLLDRLIEDA